MDRQRRISARADAERDFVERHRRASAEGRDWIERTTGRLEAFRELGLISALDLELWTKRLRTCPGHEPCQVWCAYCGDLPDDEDNRR